MILFRLIRDACALSPSTDEALTTSPAPVGLTPNFSRMRIRRDNSFLKFRTDTFGRLSLRSDGQQNY